MLYYLLTDEKNMTSCYSGFYVCRTGVNKYYRNIPSIVKANIINTQTCDNNTLLKYTIRGITNLLSINYYIENIPKYIRFILCLDNLKYEIFRGYISNNIILSDRYYLYDPKTVKKFNITVDECYITCACVHGDTAFLEWWKNSGLPLKYDEKALYYTSITEHINVLEWWKNSGLELKYNQKVILKDIVLSYAHRYRNYTRASKWWTNSGLLKN